MSRRPCQQSKKPVRESSKANASPSSPPPTPQRNLHMFPHHSSMDTWAKPSHRRDNPSFSSSLLDAIYRSIDDSDGLRLSDKHFPTTSAARKKLTTVAEKPVLHRKQDPTYYRHQHYNPVMTTTTSSSSDSSSYCGFSSDADSVFSSSRPKPIRTAPSAPRPSNPPLPPSEKKKPTSIRNRLRDMRKPRAGSAPASPGGRLASFLNTLFSGNGSSRKAKMPSPAPVITRQESTCSSATSYTRSCLTKTPTPNGRKRTVRFGPVSVVDERRYSGRRSSGADGDTAKARDSRRMVEELLRELGAAVEDEGMESDSSSDLFELEIPVVKGSRRRFMDELPVYKTTHFATNSAIANGLAMY